MKFVYGDHLRGEREAAAAAGHCCLNRVLIVF